MAEVITRDLAVKHGDGIVVSSAGTQAIEGAPATDFAQRAIAGLGLDLSHHASSPLSAELVATSDVIIAMERSHVIELVTSLGAPLDRTFTLPELSRLLASDSRAAGLPLDRLAMLSSQRTPTDAMSAPEVADPTGRSLRQHRRTASELLRYLTPVVDALGAPS